VTKAASDALGASVKKAGEEAKELETRANKKTDDALAGAVKKINDDLT